MFSMNDLSTCTDYCIPNLFADNVQIYCSCARNNLIETVNKINLDLQSLGMWAKNNGLLHCLRKLAPPLILRKRLVQMLCIPHHNLLFISYRSIEFYFFEKNQTCFKCMY